MSVAAGVMNRLIVIIAWAGELRLKTALVELGVMAGATCFVPSPKTDYAQNRISPALLMSGFSHIAMVWGRLPLCAPRPDLAQECWWRRPPPPTPLPSTGRSAAASARHGAGGLAAGPLRKGSDGAPSRPQAAQGLLDRSGSQHGQVPTSGTRGVGARAMGHVHMGHVMGLRVHQQHQHTYHR